jgi:hypothetical protein
MDITSLNDEHPQARSKLGQSWESKQRTYSGSTGDNHHHQHHQYFKVSQHGQHCTQVKG